jgi:hypothetical protein
MLSIWGSFKGGFSSLKGKKKGFVFFLIKCTKCDTYQGFPYIIEFQKEEHGIKTTYFKS